MYNHDFQKNKFKFHTATTMWQMRRDHPQKGVLFGFKNRKRTIFDIYSYTPFYIFLTFELIWHNLLKEDRIGKQKIVLIHFLLLSTKYYA